MNNTEKNAYSQDSPVFKQKVYEMGLILDQCKYDKKDKIKKDATVLLLNYKELNPVLTAINVNQFEIQGNSITILYVVPVAFNGNLFSIYIHLRFQTNYPDTQPFLFLKNIDSKAQFNQPLNLMQTHYIKAERFKMVYLYFLTISYLQQRSGIKIIRLQIYIDTQIDFMQEIQSALSRNFPFFLKNNPQLFNQSQFQYNPQQYSAQPNFSQLQQQQMLYNQSQHRVSEPIQNQWGQPPQQSGFMIPPQQQLPSFNPPQQYIQVPQGKQQLYNPYQSQPQSDQSKVVQKELKQEMKEEPTIGKKLLNIGTSVFEFGKDLLQSKEVKEQKIIDETKSKVDLELINSSKKLEESTFKQRQLTDNLLNIHLQQQIIQRDIAEKDKEIKASINLIDQQMTKLEQNIETCVTLFSQQNENDFEELIEIDPLGNQIIELQSDLIASKEALFFVQKKFRYQQLDYDLMIKVTRQLSGSLFDSHLLLKKCTGKL